ncbi:Uncharacterised protein [Anaerotruncus sp. 2789STDY5834896]|uniref:Uncharacterized protein n=1 Tax=uncultured Anaerotruncus sp. TaxID=905011 RepID=A0A1C6HP21_9FIRM|nr:Uncharacterised protein [uncultured Anaerotruncus sp.]
MAVKLARMAAMAATMATRPMIQLEVLRLLGMGGMKRRLIFFFLSALSPLRSSVPDLTSLLASFFSRKEAMGIPMNIWKATTSMAKPPSSGLPAATADSLVMTPAITPPAMGEAALRAYSRPKSMVESVKLMAAKPTRPIRAIRTVFHSFNRSSRLMMVPTCTSKIAIPKALIIAGRVVSVREEAGMILVQKPTRYTAAPMMMDETRPFVFSATRSPNAKTITNTANENSGVHKLCIRILLLFLRMTGFARHFSIV